MGGAFRFGVDDGEHCRNLLVGANHTDYVAGEDAGVGRGNYNEVGTALYHHDAYAVALTDFGVHQSFTHEGATIAHVDVGEVEVAHKVVVFARAAQLAFVEVVEELILDVPQLQVKFFRQHEQQQDEAPDADEQAHFQRIVARELVHDES